MTDWVTRMRPLALALWNNRGGFGAALGLSDETTRLLESAGLNSVEKLLKANAVTVLSAFPFKADAHMERLTTALAAYGLRLEMSVGDLTEIQQALILPNEVTANL